ncbi:MAG: protein phosphatase 2C domain-containing protein [Acidobacteria bacterium]|nr:protein phosphatase 2C domain-containing protein [Acidobacteriota bacterium]
MAANPWRVAGASVRGSGHIQSGQPCQDAHLSVVLPGGWWLAAVADGAGSASRSQTGAEQAVQAALTALRDFAGTVPARATEEAWRQGLLGALHAARHALDRAAASENLPVREFATALSLLVAGPEAGAALQVGDGAVVAARPDGSLHTLLPPQTGEYANETNFLVSPRYQEAAGFHHFTEPYQAFGLFTDGLQRLALNLPETTPHGAFFNPLFRYLAAAGDSATAVELTAFLASPRVTDRTDDDATLVLGVRAALQR